jgi:VIT1/CCC1 family predicted Fe2+/Mn2+ transporter
VPNSPQSATRADDELLRKACAEAIEELVAARKLLEKQGIELQKQTELLKLEQEISAKLKEINGLSKSEKAELWNAINKKDAQISALEAANATLKKRKVSVWQIIKISVVAGAGGLILGKVLK